jgi:enamidase
MIQGARIAAFGPEPDIAVPDGANIIDVDGGTILPGLIDSHVHAGWKPGVRREFLELGVTSVCDLGSPIERMADFEQGILNGRAAARGFRAGPILTAPGGLPGAVLGGGLNYEVSTPEEARLAVVKLLDRGVDVVKVYLQPTGNNKPYPMLSDAVLRAVVAEAHAQGIIVRAHVTRLSVLPMTLDSGVDVIEHVPEDLPSEEAVVHLVQESDDLVSDLQNLYLVDDYDTLLPRMAGQEVVLMPTMARLLSERYGAQEEPWQRALADALLEVVRRFHAAGGVIALGTDYSADSENLRPDLFRHELVLLQASGLTSIEAIEAATRHAARVCGHGSDLGTIEAGKLADILVVGGDPIADLRALEGVMIVVKDGEVAYGGSPGP